MEKKVVFTPDVKHICLPDPKMDLEDQSAFVIGTWSTWSHCQALLWETLASIICFTLRYFNGSADSELESLAARVTHRPPSRYKPVLNVVNSVSGWGEASPTSSISDVLLEVELPIRNQMYCRETYGAICINISDSQLCAGGIAGKDACQGASGGPLMMKNPKNERWFVAGIVSFGKGCGEQERPGVYTRITSYLKWIKENVLLI
jgi:Trypsin